MIRKEAWSFYRTTSGVSSCWELEKPQGLKKDLKVSPHSKYNFSPVGVQGDLAHNPPPYPPEKHKALRTGLQWGRKRGF